MRLQYGNVPGGLLAVAFRVAALVFGLTLVVLITETIFGS